MTSPCCLKTDFAGPAPQRLRRAIALVLACSLGLVGPSGAQLPGGSGAPQDAYGSASSLPALGDGSAMTTAAERRLGDRIAMSIYRDPDVIDDPILSDYVQSLWQPLRSAARSRGELSPELDERFAWDIFLIRDRSVNAFALPGGYFGIHLGLIGAVGTSDELAAVMAHELSHVTQRHISRLMTQQSRQAPWLLAAMILGALAAGKNANLGSAAMVGGQAAAIQGQLNFSRDMEREADRVGYGVMTGAGFDSAGVTGMFDKLQQGARLNDSGAFPYLRSHPLTTERLAEAQSRLQLETSARGAQSAGTAALANAAYPPMLHAMMAARARVLSAPGPDALRAALADGQRRVQSAAAPGMVVTPAASQTAAAIYGAVLAATRLRDFDRARELLEPLVRLAAGDARTRSSVDLLSIDVDLQAGRVPATAATFDIAKAATRAEVLVQARSLLAADRARPVAERLQAWVADNPRDAGAWQLLAEAYGKQKQDVRAIRADAESRAAQLEYSGALDRMRAAQNFIRTNPGSADYMESSIIDTRTRQIEAMLKERLLQEKLDR